MDHSQIRRGASRPGRDGRNIGRTGSISIPSCYSAACRMADAIWKEYELFCPVCNAYFKL